MYLITYFEAHFDPFLFPCLCVFFVVLVVSLLYSVFCLARVLDVVDVADEGPRDFWRRGCNDE